MIEKQAIKIFCFENIFLNIILFLEILNDLGIYCFSSKYICMCIRDEVCLICTCTCYGIRSILSLQKQDHAKKNTPKTMKISD